MQISRTVGGYPCSVSSFLINLRIAIDVYKRQNKGCKEIMLLGQNVNSYGKGLNEDIDFSKLLRRLNAVSYTHLTADTSYN